jgi:hypothetical protein
VAGELDAAEQVGQAGGSVFDGEPDSLVGSQAANCGTAVALFGEWPELEPALRGW